MQLVSLLALALFLLTGLADAQVLKPEEVLDPNLRELQREHWAELKQIAAAAGAHHFPYHFYFSRTMDLSEAVQRESDQRAIQFDRYHDQTVLKITGNYFASYSAELMPPEERARQTYQDVMLPLLEAAVGALGSQTIPEAFALEISHHVRKKVMGVSSEAAENVVMIVPRAVALRLRESDPMAKQSVILESQVFLNAVPIALWPNSAAEVLLTSSAKPGGPVPVRTASLTPIPNALVPVSTARPEIFAPMKTVSKVAAAERDGSHDGLKKVQAVYQSTLDHMVEELNGQAHFVRYSPPMFIPFHKGLYLQLALTTALPEGSGGSQYRMVALAFDRHIARLIRPTLEYFKDEASDFDGISFSTTVRAGSNDSEGAALAVEFIFPMRMLRLYQQFDCTGQMLIDSAFVLINGERSGVDLQSAEAVMARQ